MNAWLKPRLEIAHAIPTSAAQLLRVIFSCQVCWRTMRWHNGRTRRSPNPNPEEVFRDCVTNGERSAAHSILARSYCSNEGRIHLRRPTCPFHVSLEARRRTIHSGSGVDAISVSEKRSRHGDNIEKKNLGQKPATVASQ